MSIICPPLSPWYAKHSQFRAIGQSIGAYISCPLSAQGGTGHLQNPCLSLAKLAACQCQHLPHTLVITSPLSSMFVSDNMRPVELAMPLRSRLRGVNRQCRARSNRIGVRASHIMLLTPYSPFCIPVYPQIKTAWCMSALTRSKP